MKIHAQAEGFAKVADSYVRGRPDYPAPMIEWMRNVTGVAAGAQAIDLGAGTGKFTSTLVGLGLCVTAIEPVDEMRAQLLAALPNVRALGDAVESMSLPDDSADLLTCAQSFHWFANEKAVAEMARVLRDEHFLILVWNQRDLSDPVQHKLEEILERHQDPDIPHSPSHRWKAVIDGSKEFDFVLQERFAHIHRLPRAAVFDRLRSMSVFSSLPNDVQQNVSSELDAILPSAEIIELPYFNEAFAYRRQDLTLLATGIDKILPRPVNVCREAKFLEQHDDPCRDVELTFFQTVSGRIGKRVMAIVP